MSYDTFDYNYILDQTEAENRYIEAGWEPDIAGEIEAEQLLLKDLDEAQLKYLAEMQEWDTEDDQ